MKYLGMGNVIDDSGKGFNLSKVIEFHYIIADDCISIKFDDGAEFNKLFAGTIDDYQEMLKAWKDEQIEIQQAGLYELQKCLDDALHHVSTN